MAIKDVFKVSRKTFFDPRGWVSYDSLKEGNQTIWSGIEPLFTPDTPEREETFEEAMTRLGLRNEDVEKIEKNYFFYAMLFVALAIITLLFSFYLLILHTVVGFFIGVPVAGLFLAQAFRYHFWYFQIKNRKLGCTYEEWRRGKINENEGPAE